MDFDYLLISFIRAFGLLAITYNPTGWCFFGWIDYRPDLPSSLVLFVAIILTLGYMFFFKQAMKRVGGRGIILVILLFYLFVTALVQMNIRFTISIPYLAEWIMLAIIAAFMALAVTVRD